MTIEQIQSLFWETIEAKQPYGKAIYNVVSGVTKDTLYNWTKKRGPEPTIGDMLGLLFQMNLLEFEKTKILPQVSKKIFRQWMCGAILGSKEFTLSETKKANSLSLEILEFAETHHLLNFKDETEPTREQI